MAANKLGVSTGTVQRWEHGEYPKMAVSDPAVGDAVAEMMRLDRRGVVELTQNLDRPIGYDYALGSAVSHLRNAHGRWERSEKVLERGTIGRVRYHALLGIEPHPADFDRLGGYDGIRSLLENSTLKQVWDRYGFHWRTGNPPGWETHPELLIQIPSQERTRPPPATANKLAQRLQILTICPPWGHAELMGSFVADALLFGYIDLRYPGPFAAGNLDPVAAALRASTNGHVVSVGCETTATTHYDLIRRVAERSGVVILCTYESVMKEVGRRVYSGVGGSGAIDRLMDEFKNTHAKVMEVHFVDEDYADLPLASDITPQEYSDRACDLTLSAARDVMVQLKRRFSEVPDPREWMGPLKAFSDTYGRLNWERKTRYNVRWL